MCARIVFYIQKEIIRIISGTNSAVFCGQVFRKFNILPHCRYILLLLLILVMDSVGKCQSSSDRHGMSTNIDVTYMCQVVT